MAGINTEYKIHCNINFILFQPPPLIDGFPVLHYVVSYNTSDNSTLIHTQVNSSTTSYTVSGVPGVTYYITVFAVNALGPWTYQFIHYSERLDKYIFMCMFVVTEKNSQSTSLAHT